MENLIKTMFGIILLFNGIMMIVVTLSHMEVTNMSILNGVLFVGFANLLLTEINKVK